MLTKYIYYRPRLESILSVLDRGRMKLSVVDPRILFDEFDRKPVTLTALPRGEWSSPVADVVTLAKIALCVQPARILEVGSYRGYTTRLLAEHTPSETTIVAFDREPQHGEAYRNTPLAARVDRRVGEVNTAAFAADPLGSYDLIFLDADHTFAAVKRDTEVLLPLLSSRGVFVWHDYANWGRFSQKNGVPEALHELARSLPIVSIDGSWLAAYAPVWATQAGAGRFAEATREASDARANPWETRSLRG